MCKKVISENGVRRLVWIPKELDEVIEKTRKRLGMSKSAFYRYAITRLLEEMSVLSTKAKENPEEKSHDS